MDILITDSMLKKFLDTSATPEKIAECVSLCGPSIERITKEVGETVYHTEVTTNRVDAASARGIARETAAILKEFDIKADFTDVKYNLPKEKGELPVTIEIDEKLCSRFVATLLTNISIGDSSKDIQSQLTAVEQRPLNNAIDITNYIMFLYGVPLHAFDADLLGDTIIVRNAKKGEKFTTLDDRTHTANGSEIVFVNKKGEIIDLPGVMGAKNTSVTDKTKNILLVSEHMNPLAVREASLSHELRTHAATINEKDPDPNAIPQAFAHALELFKEYTKAKHDTEIYDWYKEKRVEQKVNISLSQITTLLGVELKPQDISRMLENLGFAVSWKKDTATITVPTWRVTDVVNTEDIVEEIARMYGYFKLPSVLPASAIPTEPRDPQFAFEDKIRTTLKGFGGYEVYTLSFVSQKMAEENALKVRNPLGGDGEYMRTKLIPSLKQAAQENTHTKSPFHLFELANVYLSQGKKLPNEQMHVAGVFAHTDYRQAKGIVEALFEELHCDIEPTLTKEGDLFFYEYSIEELSKHSKPHKQFEPISKYPSQIEDMTVVMKKDTKTKDVMDAIAKVSTLVKSIELADMYEDAYTFRIHYHDNERTLTDEDITSIRAEVLSAVKALKLSVK